MSDVFAVLVFGGLFALLRLWLLPRLGVPQ